MPHNYYSEINLHVTWHTKDGLPLLTPTVEPLVHRYIKQRLIHEKGVFVHEIGGIETHIHLVVTVPPTTVVSELIGQLKGASAHEINQQVGFHGKPLQWQAGYGVVSFGTGDLEWVKAYVRNQRRHHADGKTFDRLERFSVPNAEQDARERA
jgi:putative transposase